MNGVRIREARKYKGFTQDELAKQIGVKRAVISKYETGIIEPSISQLQKIAEVLGVSIFDLLPQGEISKEMFTDVFGDVIEKSNAVVGAVNYNQRKDSLNKTFDSLNEKGQRKAVENVEDLAKIPDYQKEKSP